MFTHRFSRLIATVGGLLASTIALAQDTSISYQGYVTNNDGIIQGPTDYSMTFRLFDSAGGPTPLPGGIIGPITVSVEKSLFSVPLAFPTNLWTGADRWLEVQIGAEILTPRQKIRWVPYAIYALNAADRNSLDAADGTPADAVFVDASGFAGFGTTTPQARLHVQGDSFWLGGTDAAGFAAAAGPGMRFFNTPTESNINAADYSAGTPRPLVLQHQGGSVGVGGLPAAGNKLDVVGQIEMDAFKMATGAAAGRILTSDATGVGTWQAAPGGGGPWTVNGANINNNNTGNVGVGTGATVPLAKLHITAESQSIPAAALENDDLIVEAGDATIGLYSSPGGNAASAIAFKEINAGALVDTWGIYRLTTGGGAGMRFSYGLTDNYANNTTVVQINPNGDFGIGTTSPGNRLHVRKDFAGPTGMLLENLTDDPAASTGITFLTRAASPAYVASISLSDYTSGEGLLINAPSRLRISAPDTVIDGPLGGNLSIFGRFGTTPKIEMSGGLTNPSSGLMQVRNTTDVSVVQISGGGNNDSGEIRLYRTGQATETVEIVASDNAGQGAGMALRRGNGSDGIYLNAEAGTGDGAEIWVYNDTGTRTIILDGDYQGTGVGRVITDVLEITGADLAEKFPTSEEITPGMVVAIDVNNEGKLCLSRGAYNRTVAGVVSGARDFSVGAILGSRAESADGPPIALAGRVYVWCDADAAPIKPGDLLTTSHVPGHAMKVLDHDAAQGAILGKAMGSLDKGTGLLLVLINLQ